MLVVGIFSGILGALLGLGGGIIVTPILVIGFNLPIHYAIGASIIAVIATSSGASIAYLKDDMLNLRMAMFLEIFTTIGALAGALLAIFFKAIWLNFLFGILLVYQAYRMWRKLHSKKVDAPSTKEDHFAQKMQLNSSYFDKSTHQQIDYKVENVAGGALAMIWAGIASGLLGIGSGMFKVFAMDTVMKMPLKPSSATSNLMMGVTAATSALVYFFNGTIKANIAVPIALGILLGATIGARLMPHIPAKRLRQLFIPVVGIAGLQLLLKAFNITLY
ncbi:sulfite exporter TauE/SafE family protein [Leuconostoc fallax]|uniref:Probable membrane transporter protein n=1 Tax=Leuconostoc fallax TaxID=1251 RepID=A0A4R5NAS2_9LACO|nr:sulfite exporter TauE/SafE family protein [Leuconostoc fallax]MBU7454989.1 sulfite exporter TauE/SafE family protein [Leuconostoc fallax]TDG69554.1 hypothetical protein C5L23_001016 [Leuconostoc fallax]